MNSEFFHAKATSRKRLNYISYVINDLGDRVNRQKEMSKLVKEYYKLVFASSKGDHNLQVAEDEWKVTRDHNTRLVAELSFKEFEMEIK